MPDPFHLLDMDKAVERISAAVLRSENIAIFGDYDVDGATSSALLKRFFRMMGKEVRVYIPDRLSEGYGLNTDALLQLHKEGIDLVITVDCGTVSIEPIAEAKKAGLDVIVVDHHMSMEELPAAVAVINPNRLDEGSAHRNLAAVGVAFLLAVAVRSHLRSQGYFSANPPEPDLLKLLDLVAVGTICDVVQLNGLNRAYVSRGLLVMKQRANKGLAALADVAGITTVPDTYHAGFVIGPRINAGGRIGKSDLGCRLLSTEDTSEAMDIAAEMDKLNKERQAIERQVLERALAIAEGEDSASPFLCVAEEGWHSGVIGIVASRLTEKYGKPTAVVAINDGEGKASVRSIAGVDIGAAITAAKMEGHITNGGGHPMAAGFTVDAEKLPTLKHFIGERIKKEFEKSSTSKILKIDGLIGVQSVTTEIAKALLQCAPYGMGNREPRFIITHAKIIESSVVGENHVRCILGDGSPNANSKTRLKGIAFRHLDTKLGKELMSGYGHVLHIAGRIKLDSWQGRERADLLIEDVVRLS
jgi:single-stranded-DNA-specific exonuclease